MTSGSQLRFPLTLNCSDFASVDSLSKPSSPCPDLLQDGPPSERLTRADSTATNSMVKKSAKKPKKKKQQIIFNVSDTRYDVVKFVGEQIFNWKLSYDMNGKWDVFWTDGAVQPETLARMRPYQKINHFPGMYCLARKNHLGKNLMRLRRAFPEAFKFFPQTYLLPAEYTEFRAQFAKKTPTFIVKPEASCQGRGIFLTKNCDSIQPGEHYVVQKYLSKPYLIDGLKFDLRVYVLLAGCDPLRIYVYHDGLARFATEQYVQPTGKNLENMCMHLTNYAVNKHNPNFVFNTSEQNDNEGHKRSLKGLMKTLEDQGHDVSVLWKEIKKLIIKTFCSVQPILAQNYRACQTDEPYNNMCFEILGFDIMLDHKLKPYLLEVNHTPSFTTDTPLDRNIKKNVIKDALTLMNISSEFKAKYKKKKKIELKKRMLTGKATKISPEERRAEIERAQKERDEWESQNLGGFEKVFPLEDPTQADENYDNYLKESNKWWEGWTGTNKRTEKRSTSEVAKMPPMTFGLASPLNKQASSNSNRDAQSNLPQNQSKPRKPAYTTRPSSFHLHSTNSSLKVDITAENDTKNNYYQSGGNDYTMHWLEKEEGSASIFDHLKEIDNGGVDQQQGAEKILDHKSIIEEDFEESDRDCQAEDDDDDDCEENRYENSLFRPRRNPDLDIKIFDNDSFEEKTELTRKESKDEEISKQRPTETEKGSFFRIRTSQSYAFPREPSYKTAVKDNNSNTTKNRNSQISLEDYFTNRFVKPFISGRPETTQNMNALFTESVFPDKAESSERPQMLYTGIHVRSMTKPVVFEFEKERAVLGRVQTQSQSYRGKQTISFKVSPKAVSSIAGSPKSQPQFWNYFASKAIELKIKKQGSMEPPKEQKPVMSVQGHRPGSRTYVKKEVRPSRTLTLSNIKSCERIPTVLQVSPQAFTTIKRK